MSAFTIFAIVVTVGYILYYAAIITIDLNSKPKGESSNEETVDTGGLVSDTQEEDEENPETEHKDESQEQLEQEEEYYNRPQPSEEDQSSIPVNDEQPDPNVTGQTNEQQSQESEETESSTSETETQDGNGSENNDAENQTASEDEEQVENDNDDSDDDSDTELTEEEKAALMAEFQSSMENDDDIQLVEPKIHEEDEIFDDLDEDKYEVKEIISPEEGDEGAIAKAINSTLEETVTESTMPMDNGLLTKAALGQLGVELDGISHFDRP